MNGSAKRMMAVMFAAVMVASAMVVVLVDEQDSSATPVETATYYRDQLELDFSKEVYDVIIIIYTTGDETTANHTIEGMNVTIKNISAADKTTIADNMPLTDNKYLSKMINKGIIAAIYDNPLVGFYISSTYPATDISSAGDYSTVSFTVNKVESFTSPLSTYKDTMTDALATETASFTGDIPTMITSIHDRVVGLLEYDSAHTTAGEPIASQIRSVYTAMCDDHAVVCEGYAKLFKVFCDAKEIPCLIVTGPAGTGSSSENHMWNYVKVGSFWYLVDCTWDDQDPMVSDYLMAGWATEAVHFGNTMIVDSHNPSGLDSGLKVNESLSYYEYGNPATQHEITFLLDPVNDPGIVYLTQYVGDGATVHLPDDPEDSIGHHFFGWYVHESDTEYDFNTVVNADMTIDGKWTIKEVYALKYDTCGGTNVQATRVEYDDNTTKITNVEPKREGFNFIEWNTSKDGNGVAYHAGDDITLIGDCTLYAVWEDTSSITFKVDSIIDQAAEFLSQETIPGVSNFLLTIGIVTSVVSLLAVIAIARK